MFPYQVTFRRTSGPDQFRSIHVVQAEHRGAAIALAGTEAIERGYGEWDVANIILVERPCRFCGAQVTSSKPEVDFCQLCFYLGSPFEERFEDLLTQLTALLETETSVWHTGGGCFALGGSWPDGSFWMATDGSAGLPESPDGPWMVGYYPDEEHEGFYTGDSLEADLHGVDELVGAIAQLRERHGP